MPEPLLPVAVVGRSPGRRGQALPGPRPAGRRGPDAAARDQPRDPPARAVVDGRGAPRRAARPAAEPVRRRRRRRCRCGWRCARRSPAPATGPRPACQAVRRPRPVRRRATSRSSRCRRAAGSSSSTRSSAARCPGSSSPASRRASAPRWSAGVAAGYPMVDIRVTLVDGKSHSVDSSDMAFQTAGALALKEAAKAAGVAHARAVDEVQVLVDDEYVGAVMGDLSTRRGRVTGTEPVGTGRTDGRGRGARSRAHPLRDRPALACRTAPARSPGSTSGTRRCRSTRSRRCCRGPRRGRRSVGEDGGCAAFSPTPARTPAPSSWGRSSRCSPGAAGLLQPLSPSGSSTRCPAGGPSSARSSRSPCSWSRPRARAANSSVLGRTAERVVLDVAPALARRLVRLRVDELDHASPGDLISRITADSSLLRSAATTALVDLVDGALRFVGALILMGWLDLRLLARLDDRAGRRRRHRRRRRPADPGGAAGRTGRYLGGRRRALPRRSARPAR